MAKENITLWRAADDDYIGDSASFAESREVAELYLDNPSFGGARLYRAEVEAHDVLDLTSDGAERLRDALGSEPRFGGAVGLDEIVPRIAEDLRDAGYQWVRVPESYPAGTVTWVYVGGSSGEEPELVEA
jgi:hypothetical protein